jgi:hypothetical protein
MWLEVGIVTGSVIALGLVLGIWKEFRYAHRHLRVAADVAASDPRTRGGLGLQSVSPVAARDLDSRRPAADRLREMRTLESRHSDPATARVLRFHEHLAVDGRYVHELSLERRLN